MANIIDPSFASRRNALVGESGATKIDSKTIGNYGVDPSFQQRRVQILTNPASSPPNPFTMPSPAPQVQPVQPKKSVFQSISEGISQQFQKIGDTVKKNAPKDEAGRAIGPVELTAIYFDPAKVYVKNAAKSVLEAVKGVGKLTQPYMAYRAAIGDPVTPKEYLENLKNSGIDTLDASWKISTIAPAWGATTATFKEIRKAIEGESNLENIAKAPTRGINQQPGVGEMFTDNVKYAQAIDIVFMAGMFSRPFAKKAFSQVGKNTSEIRQASQILGVKPSSSMSKIEQAFKTEIKKIPDTFTSNPNPANMARRQELTNAYNILKKTGAVDRAWAGAWDFLSGGKGQVPREAGAPTQAPKTAPKLIGAETGKPAITSPSSVRVPKDFRSPVEKRAFEKVQKPEFIDEYKAKFQNEVNPDLALTMLDGYEGYNAAELSRASGAAKAALYDSLLASEKGIKNNTVLITAGGSGSGKSTSIGGMDYARNKYSIVVDTTFSHNSAIEDIKRALDSGYKANISYTFRDPIEAWEDGALKRIGEEGRVVSEGYFLQSHIDAQKNIVKAEKKFSDNPDVSIDVSKNADGSYQSMTIDELKQYVYDRPTIAKRIIEATDKAYEQGRITKAEYEAATADREKLGAGATGQREQKPSQEVSEKGSEQKSLSAKDLVESKTPDEIQTKLQEVFGTYDELDKLEAKDNLTPLEEARIQIANRYMADIERAAMDRDMGEAEALLETAKRALASAVKTQEKPPKFPTLPAEEKPSPEVETKISESKDGGGEVAEAQTMIQEAIYSGDLEAAKDLYNDLSKKLNLASFDDLQSQVDDAQRSMIDEVSGELNSSEDLPDDSPTKTIIDIAKRMGVHFKAPGSLFKVTGKHRVYTDSKGNQMEVGGTTRESFDRLIFATDIDGFGKNIGILSEKFDKVFTQLHDTIKSGGIDGADYDKFKEEFGKLLDQRPTYNPRSRSTPQASDKVEGAKSSEKTIKRVSDKPSSVTVPEEAVEAVGYNGTGKLHHVPDTTDYYLEKDGVVSKLPPVTEQQYQEAISKPKEAEVVSPIEGVEQDIDLQTATNAYSALSFNPERAGARVISEYVAGLKSDYEDLTKLVDSDEKKVLLDQMFNKFREGVKKRTQEALAADSRTMSSMITGPARFPAEKNRQKMEYAMRKWEELQAYEKYMVKKMRETLNPTERQQFAGTDKGTIDAVNEKLTKLKEAQARMKEANKIIRSKENVTAKLVELGFEEKQAMDLQEPDWAGRSGFADYQLTSINNKIKTLEKTLESKTKKREIADTEGSKETVFEGGKIVRNYDEDRLQIVFDEIPDATMRDSLKGKGFKWSPKNKAWQRKLTNNAIYDTKRLLGEKLSPAKPAEEFKLAVQELPKVEAQAQQDIFAVTGEGGLTKEGKAQFSQKQIAEARAKIQEKYSGGKEGLTPLESTVKTPIEEATGNLGFNPKNLEDPFAPAAQEELDKIVKQSDIAKYLSEKLGVPIRRGKFNLRGALGVFKRQPQVVRIKKGGLQTVFHEVAHFMDAKFDLSRRIDKEEAKALMSEYGYTYEGKPRRQQEEAFAEYMRFRMTGQTEKIKEWGPKLDQNFNMTLDSMPEVKEVIETATRDFSRWNAQPATSKILSQLSIGTQKNGTLKERAIQNLHDLYMGAVDDLHPLSEFSALYKKKTGKALPAIEDPYILARNFRGWTGKADLFLNKGTFKKEFWAKNEKGKTVMNFTGKSYSEILGPVEKKHALDDFRVYIVAERIVNDLAPRKIVTGISLKDAEEALAELDKKYPEFKGISADRRAYKDSLMEFAKENGLVGEEGLKRIRELNKYHVPFYRVMEESQVRFMGKTKLAGNLPSPIKKIKGSEREIIDPLESDVKDTYAIINAAERNNIGVAMARLAKENFELGRLFEQVDRPMMGTKVDVAEVINQALKGSDLIDGINTKKGTDVLPEEILDEMAEAVTLFRPTYARGPNMLNVNMGDKQMVFEVDPNLFKSIQGLEVEDVGIIMRLLSLPARTLRAGATLTPDFSVRNPLRDQFTAAVYSKYGFVPGVDLVRGMFELFKKGDTYNLWKAGGGEQSMFVSLDRNELQKTFKEVLEGNGARLLNYIKNPVEALRLLSEFGEAGTRLGEMKRALGKGANPVEGAFATREVTLDFSRIGTKTRAVNAIVAFFNSGLQGTDKMIRSFKDRRFETLWKTLVGITLPSILLYMVNRDDPRWDEIPQWQKNLFWIVFTRDHIFRIPKPFELGVLFGSVPERALEVMDQKDPTLFNELQGAIVSGFIPSVLPTSIIPIIENITNYSFFLDRPIVGRGQENLPPEQQASLYTSDVAKILGKALNYSPAKIDNLVYGYTGGLGRYATTILDKTLEGTGITNEAPAPAKKFEDIAVVKAFTVREPIGSQSESVNKLYSIYNRTNAQLTYAKQLINQGKPDEATQYIKDHPDTVNAVVLGAAVNNFSEINRAIDEIRRSETMKPEDKTQKIDTLQRLQTNLARKVLDKLPSK